MSLYVLPVSVSDLTQLQFGLEFFTNTTEATNEAALITNPPYTATVDSYAAQLLANNISLSQVAMAVDSLMFGVTDSTTELTKLARQFLPPQVSVAVANGLNPTLYAAEVLGLALAGGNGTSHAFETNFGPLDVAHFASKVASLTGINSAAIQGFAQNWINFYTANPSATGGLSVTLAAYGAAFGDAVGVALVNPTANGDVALLVSEEQNALIDNAEGLYTVGIPLILEPPHLPLQGEALLIPNAGGPPFYNGVDWGQYSGNYAQFVAPAQSGDILIGNAPSTFTLNTQHFATTTVGINAAGNNGDLCTLILGDSSAGESFGPVGTDGYATVHLVASANASIGAFLANRATDSSAHLVVSGSGSDFLLLGVSAGTKEGHVSVEVNGGTITAIGVQLALGVTDAGTIDASNASRLDMELPVSLAAGVPGITVLGSASGNDLQGSLGGIVVPVTLANGDTGVWATLVGADNITGGSGGGDFIFGDGGPDTITLPSNHLNPDTVEFGLDGLHVLVITDGLDIAYPGFWGATASTTIPNLFSGPTGGTSADMTTITGFHAGSGGDRLVFDTAAWNGADSNAGIAANGDLVDLVGISVVPVGGAQLSAVWVNHDSNSSLRPYDNVLLYAPAGGSPHNAQELAAQLHGAAGAITLPGLLLPGQDQHILVAYDASPNVLPILAASAGPGMIVTPVQRPEVVHIADVDLVNLSGSAQNSTFNVNVYASDMVSLTGVSLTNLTSDNIHFG
jgi:hypothetical protein